MRETEAIAGLSASGHTVIVVGQGKRILGALSVCPISRAPRRSPVSVPCVRPASRVSVMLTGDMGGGSAMRIGRALGLRDDDIAADLPS